MTTWQSAENGTEGRRLLEERLAALHSEEHKYIFRTNDSYRKEIRNRSGIKTNVGLYHGSLFIIIPIAGVVETIEYAGLRMMYPGSSIDSQSTQEEWNGLGTLALRKHLDRSFDDDLVYGFFIDGVNYRFQIYSEEKEERCNEDIAEKIRAEFELLRKFEQKTEPISRFLKPVYDLRTILGV